MLIGSDFAEIMHLDFPEEDQDLFFNPPLHTSPEKSCNSSLDIRSDLYNLGIIFYTLLTNSVPVQVTPSLVASGKHIEAPTTRSLPANMEIFQPFFDRAIASDSEVRFKSGQELVAALDSINDEEIAYIKNQHAMASSALEASKPENSKPRYGGNVIQLTTAQNIPKDPPKNSAKPETHESKNRVNRQQDSITDVVTPIAANEQQPQNQPSHMKSKLSPKRVLLLFFIILAVTCYILMQLDESYRVALYNQLDQLIKQLLRL